MSAPYKDPELVAGVLNDNVHYLEEALWEFLHDPTEDNLNYIEAAANEVASEAHGIVHYVRVGHEKSKGGIVG